MPSHNPRILEEYQEDLHSTRIDGASYMLLAPQMESHVAIKKPPQAGIEYSN